MKLTDNLMIQIALSSLQVLSFDNWLILLNKFWILKIYFLINLKLTWNQIRNQILINNLFWVLACKILFLIYESWIIKLKFLKDFIHNLNLQSFESCL
jgi:hypothetical protein